jgi:hypothetical protein
MSILFVPLRSFFTWTPVLELFGIEMMRKIIFSTDTSIPNPISTANALDILVQWSQKKFVPDERQEQCCDLGVFRRDDCPSGIQNCRSVAILREVITWGVHFVGYPAISSISPHKTWSFFHSEHVHM